jgi:hypothetical protein
MYNRGISKSRAICAALIALLCIFSASESFAQTAQYYHSRGVLLDDGSGHTVTLLPPTTGGASSSSMLWPNSNGVGVLTNDGSGNLTWVTAGSTTAQVVSTNNTYTGGGSVSTDQTALSLSANAAFFKIDASAANVNVDGVDATGSADGRIVTFANVGSSGHTVTFVNASGAASANNQFLMSGDVTISNNTVATFIYDITAHKWRLVSYSG